MAAANETQGTETTTVSESLPAKVSARMGMVPRTVEEGWRLSQMIAKSELVPKGFRNKPYDVMVAMQFGSEIGFAPMQALQSIAVINGRPCVWGDGFLALIMANPLYADHDESYDVGGQRADGLTPDDLTKDDTTAVCSFWRVGKRTPVTRRFSIGQAKKAGLWGKEGPWQTYPDRMLAMRARSWAGRDGFPDALRGVRSTEEAMDDPPPLDLPTPDVRRLSERADPPAETSAPVPLPMQIGPVCVTAVIAATDQGLFGGEGFLVHLSDGQVVSVLTQDDAAELEKFVGTDHCLRVTCEAVDAGLRVRAFEIAE